MRNAKSKKDKYLEVRAVCTHQVFSGEDFQKGDEVEAILEVQEQVSHMSVGLEQQVMGYLHTRDVEFSIGQVGLPYK